MAHPTGVEVDHSDAGDYAVRWIAPNTPSISICTARQVSSSRPPWRHRPLPANASYELAKSTPRTNLDAVALAARMAPLKGQGLFPDYPFGHDFTDIELALSRALPVVKAEAARTPKWKLLWRALRAGRPDARWQPHLARMQLQNASSLQDKVVATLLSETLSRQA